MSTEFQFTCTLEHGIHARPASMLTDAIRGLDVNATMTKQALGQSADVRSVLSVVALNVGHGDSCVIRAEGVQAENAISALRTIIDNGFGESAAQEQQSTVDSIDGVLPAGLNKLGVHAVFGRCINPGFARAPVMVAARSMVRNDLRSQRNAETERRELNAALHHVEQQIQIHLGTSPSVLERDLLKAHANIVDDPALRQAMDDHLTAGFTAASAVRRASDGFVEKLKASSSAYVRDRAIDVEDICRQVLEQLGAIEGTDITELNSRSIIAAETLTPRQVMLLQRKQVCGLVVGAIGATSHTAILVRAFGIPALMGVPDIETRFRNGQEIILDAGGGFVLPEVSEEVRRYYEIERRMTARRRTRLQPFIAQPAKTRNGTRLEIAANVSSADEVGAAMREGAEGMGLFRTEMLFLDCPVPPTEDQQVEEYSNAVVACDGRPVIFRTLDIGGDKPAPYLRLPKEENPFLGWRGIRLYEQHADILRDQLRAIAAASAHGPVKIMAPMVANVREAEFFKQRVRDVQNEVRSEGKRFDEKMPIGVMIEVPSAAMAMDQLSQVVDFFSIGTNDLSQYFFAADRGNPRVASLCDPLEPAFLRLLKNIVDDAQRHRKWIGICGEMAGDVRHLPLMVGLCVDEISVSSSSVLELKAALATLDGSACRELLKRAIECRHADEVRSLLGSFVGNAGGADGSAPIIESELVSIDSDAMSKVEVIKELSCTIAASGRAVDALSIENALWAREETYATAMGHGFAIPHCKSASVRSATIAVLGLKNPIDWCAADGEPVLMAVMLAIPDVGTAQEAAKKHMQVLAKLARQLMHEEFRDRIMQAKSPEAIVAALMSGLEG